MYASDLCYQGVPDPGTGETKITEVIAWSTNSPDICTQAARAITGSLKLVVLCSLEK